MPAEAMNTLQPIAQDQYNKLVELLDNFKYMRETIPIIYIKDSEGVPRPFWKSREEREKWVRILREGTT